MARDVDAHYATLQRRYRIASTGDYEKLVTASGNAQVPVHRWFHFKEAYSHLLLSRVVKDVGLDGARRISVFDPFSGSGTTIASAGEYSRESGTRMRVDAIETNPFLRLLSDVKGAAYAEDRPDFLRLARVVVAAVSRGRVEPLPPVGLSTFHNETYFPAETHRRLRMLSAAVQATRDGGASERESDALALCLAAAVEPSSRLRRDGRALRFEASKQVLDPVAVFSERAHEMHADWSRVAGFKTSIRLGDARDLRPPAPGSVDLVLFSPPYPNNIDYTEVYKLENWQLGFLDGRSGFAAQRQRTLRSHPSVRFERGYRYLETPHAAEVERLVGPICDAVPQSRYRPALVRTIRGYTDDMLDVMSKASASLRSGGHLVYVVGNSYHGGHNGIVVAADLIMARVGELCGLDISAMDVARVPTRRRTESAFLRETVVFARKP